MLYSPFHIHAILKLAPAPFQENAFGAHFLQLYRKNEYLTPTFCFMILVRTVLSFHEKKKWHKSMFCFLAILLKSTDWAITGRTASVQIKSTLERKVKTRELEGIFLVRQWINNTFKSNSGRCHQKNLSFLVHQLRAENLGLWLTRGEQPKHVTY